MRPKDPRYSVHPLAEAPGIDATLIYVATRSPVSDPYARYLNAEKRSWEEMMQYSKTYFNPWENIHEGNPQEILDRREAVTLPPLLIMQGELDDNVLPSVQEKFANSYRSAGGDCQYEVFAGCEHRWVAKESAQTDRAAEMVKEFIAKQLHGRRLAA
jgi:alpha-beta hydrolase superfamily lysophospholipase